MIPHISCDASHASHPDGYGQGGIVLSLGSAPIFCRSFKLKSVARSSTESELIALEEASTYAVWWKQLLHELGVHKKTQPLRIYQDNLSTIILAQAAGSFKRTKHLVTKQAYVRERIKTGDIELKYKRTDKMVADFLTKPLSGPRLNSHLNSINVN